ncbi:phosphatase PAP2 family protein [Chryseolinea lacunae]|uniref:Phosphatase PAP2 family protein n=1 Tax=Chryseolinea lacunae TaxID=2801331 RepID=A0ABS1KXB4_9BACT|nr:phosphatase PAP2 family protein [Chryseolinea lacunae]MBL0744101.1 phosphatase PAP2 family protein [Chryseolinea lacunae]
MVDQLIEWDKKLLLFLNGFHVSWLDPIVLFATETFVWLPLYLFLLYILIRTYKKDVWIPLIGITLVIVLADQITSGFMKPYFARLRPSQEPTLKGLVHLVDGYLGGLYGFASSHAANTMGTATFFTLLLRSTKPWIVWLFLWAVLLTYTRIYLGVHYPGDITVGWLIGAGCGWTGFRVAKALLAWNEKRRASSTV